MQAVIERIDNIELKIRQLVQKIELLKKENQGLLEENSQLKRDLELAGKKENEGNLAQPSGQLMMTEGSKNNSEELKRELNKYIEEIDQCLEILNQ